MDGFTINKKFRCKELAYIDVDTEQSYSYGVKLILNKKDLSGKDQTHVWYCTNIIHGLKFIDYASDCTQKEINDVLKKLSIDAGKDGRLLAYKGGRCESDLLKKLDIWNFVDLEEFNCPKFDNLIKMDYYKPVKSYDCGYHSKLKDPSKVAHCPLLEVYVYNKWYNKMTKKTHQLCE